jgi:hypothetical protein
MELIDGPVYTPEQVSANGWLGPITPGAIRKAVAKGDFEWTRIRNKIGMTKANILANQEAGFEPAAADQRSTPRTVRRGRRTPVAAVPDLPAGATRLVAKPASSRRRSRTAS